MLAPRLLGADTGAIAAMGAGDPTARIAPPGDIAALERGARELLQTPVEAEAVAGRRQALISRYSWETYLDAHLSVYQRLIA